MAKHSFLSLAIIGVIVVMFVAAITYAIKLIKTSQKTNGFSISHNFWLAFLCLKTLL